MLLNDGHGREAGLGSTSPVFNDFENSYVQTDPLPRASEGSAVTAIEKRSVAISTGLHDRGMDSPAFALHSQAVG
jgi:hypothetical protein